MASVLRAAMWMLFCSSLEARDLGVHGHRFPVQERSLVEVIRERSKSTHSEETKRRFTQIFQEPKPLQIGEAEVYRTWLFDPSVEAQEDVLDEHGEVVIPKGTKINPLSERSLTRALLFLDGSRPSHIKWARQQEGKWILVKGKPMELENTEGTPVYFDQFGLLTKKFSILRVPARVFQEGDRLRIEEIPIDEEGMCL